MRVKCICKYHDLQLNRLINENEELEVTDARGNVLIKAKVCEAITEVDTEAAPKKTTRKKKMEDN